MRERLQSRIVVVVVGAAILSAPLRAEAKEGSGVELGGFLGVHTFSQDGLGRNDEVSADSSLDSNLDFGLRLGFPVTAALGVELESAFVITETEDRLGQAVVFGYRANLTWSFVTSPQSRLRPFALAGLGGETAIIDRPMATDVATLPKATLGGGVLIPLGPRSALRFDGRALVGPGTEGAAVAVDAEILIGFCFAAGGSCGVPTVPRRAVRIAAPPPRDSDGDGIFGNMDRCPTRPEDVDGYEDDDGCPDLDDDQDGIAIPADRCPTDVETPNGWDDQDGCPDELPADAAALVGPARLTFHGDGAILDQRSLPLLDRTVEVLDAYPTLRLEIAAHVGKGEDLARERADVVRNVLMAKGVDAARLIATTVEDTADDGLEFRFVP